MINYLNKLKFGDNHYMKIYYFGAIFNVPITKEEYDNIQLSELQELKQADFVPSCYNKGNDCIIRLSLNRKGA